MAFNGDDFFQWFNSNVTGKFSQRLMVTTHSSQKHKVCYTEEECTLYCPGKTVKLPNVTKGPVLWEEVWTHSDVFNWDRIVLSLFSKNLSHISLPAGETRNKIFPCRDGERLWSLQLHQNFPLPWSKIQHNLHIGT